MSRFYIGQKVVSLTNVEISGRRKGDICKITNFFTCKCATFVSWGAKHSFLNPVAVCHCGKEHPPSNEFFAPSTSFAPLLEASEESQAFAETLVTEIEKEINEENLILK